MAQSLPISSLPSGGVIQATDATVVVRGGLNYQVTVPVDLIYQNAATLLTKANINSPALTGVPTAPTAAVGTNTTQLATTAFVRANTPSRTILADNNTWTGTNTYTVSPIVPTPVVTDTTTKAANMAAINQAVTGYTSIDVSTAVSGVITITADQIRLQWLAFTGTLTSDVVIKFPASVGKFMMISSSVITGAFSLTVGKVSGSASTYPLYTGTSLWCFTASGLGYFSTLYNSTLYGNSFYNHDIATNDNSYRLANTLFVQDIAALMGKLADNNVWSGQNTFNSATKVPTIAGTTDSTTSAASTAFVQAVAALKANLASPALTGTPTAPTAAAGTNTTQLATTAFVTNAIGDNGGGIVDTGFVGNTNYVLFANGYKIMRGKVSVVFNGATVYTTVFYPISFTSPTRVIKSAQVTYLAEIPDTVITIIDTSQTDGTQLRVGAGTSRPGTTTLTIEWTAQGF